MSDEENWSVRVNPDAHSGSANYTRAVFSFADGEMRGDVKKIDARIEGNAYELDDLLELHNEDPEWLSDNGYDYFV